MTLALEWLPAIANDTSPCAATKCKATAAASKRLISTTRCLSIMDSGLNLPLCLFLSRKKLGWLLSAKGRPVLASTLGAAACAGSQVMTSATARCAAALYPRLHLHCIAAVV